MIQEVDRLNRVVGQLLEFARPISISKRSVSARKKDDIIAEIAATRVTERGGRSDDKRSDTAMEDRKVTGYF